MIDLSTGINIVGFLGVFGFLWKLRGDVAAVDRRVSGVSERVAHIEGLLQGERNAELKASLRQ